METDTSLVPIIDFTNRDEMVRYLKDKEINILFIGFDEKSSQLEFNGQTTPMAHVYVWLICSAFDIKDRMIISYKYPIGRFELFNGEPTNKEDVEKIHKRFEDAYAKIAEEIVKDLPSIMVYRGIVKKSYFAK